MNLALIGNNDGPLRLARALNGSPHRVVAVLLQKLPAELDLLYRRANLVPVPAPDETTALQQLEAHAPELLINCFANFRFRELHRRYPTLNVHLSPLPRYRGRHPLRWALINGEPEFGISIHRMTDDWDAGDLVWQRMVPVEAGCSARELRTQLLTELEREFARFIDRFSRNAPPPKPNDPAHATYVTRRRPADSELTDWHDRDRVWRTVRALRHDAHPAFVRHRTELLRVLDAERLPRRYVGSYPTTVVGRSDPRSVDLVCGDGRTLRLHLDRAAPWRLNDRILQ